jgi:hypothetical protein
MVCKLNKIGECLYKRNKGFNCVDCCKTAWPYCGGNNDFCYCHMDKLKGKNKKER